MGLQAEGGRASLPRTMHAYEKGIIWGNDNYLIQSALVDLVLATHNVGRRGHRLSCAWADTRRATRARRIRATPRSTSTRRSSRARARCTPRGAQQLPDDAQRRGSIAPRFTARANIVKEAMAKARGATHGADGRRDLRRRAEQGRPVRDNINLYPMMFSEASHLLLPAAHPGETNLTSMNGERRCRLSEKFMDPPGSAKADCLIAAAIANTLKALYQAEGNATMAARFSGFEWKTEEDAFNDGFRRAGTAGVAPIDSQGGGTGNIATYERLRAMGNNGVQLPIKEYKDGKLIGTEMLYTDGKFDTADGKAIFKPSPWPGLPKPVADSEGQAQVLDQQRAGQRSLADRLPRQVQRVRARPLADGVHRNESARHGGARHQAGDVVEVYNDYGSTYAMAYPEPDQKPSQTFMQFGYDNGVQRRCDDQLDRPQRHPVLQGNVGQRP